MLSKLLNNLFHNKSIKIQLFLIYIVLNITIILLFGFIAYKVSSLAIVEEVEKNNNQILEIISKNINTYYKDTEKELDSIGSLFIRNEITYLSDGHNSSLINKEIQNTIEMDNDFFFSIRLFDDKGNVITELNNPKRAGAFSYGSKQDDRWKEEMAENNADNLIFSVHQPDYNGMYSFVLSKPIFQPNTDNRIGYFSYFKSLSSFSSIFREYEYRRGSILQVIKEDGTLLYHSNHSLIGESAGDYLLDKLKNSSVGSIKKKINNEDMLISFNKLTTKGLTVVGMIRISELESGINTLRIAIILLICLSFLLVFILSYFLSGYFSKPIKRLSSLMSKVEKEDFNVQIENKNINIEIDQLNSSFNSMVKKINYLIEEQYKTELLKRDVELKALLMQINPHFIYNTLEVMSGIAAENGVDQIEDITESLSEMLRYNIDINRDLVKIQDEVNYCRSYLSIMKSRFEEKINFNIDNDNEVDHYIIPKMTIQPLIENSIKYGVEINSKNAFIGVSIKKIENKIQLVVEDNGTGFESSKLIEFENYKNKSSINFEEVTSIDNLGLKNVYTRLRMFYGEELEFTIESSLGIGTKTSITYPANKMKKEEGEDYGDGASKH